MTLTLLLLLSPALHAESVGIAELSPKTEAAIDRGLQFLSNSQLDDGTWGTPYPVAKTSLGLMAFMLRGNFPDEPPYGAKLARAVNYLIDTSEKGGGYMGSSMYAHGLATLALSEVWGMSEREELRDVLKAAVKVIIGSQNKQGGWRYKPEPQDADISVTVMQIVALASASEAGIHVPQEVIDKALIYVKNCQNRFKGGFGYTPSGGPGFARTAAGVMSLQMCGERNTRAVKAGLYFLKQYPDKKFTMETHYFYAHYYAIQAMYQAGEEHYETWYPRIRNALLSKQTGNGSWKSGNGDAYATGMAILILGVPYRFLPIYQR